MDDSEAVSLEQIRDFLAGSGEVRFAGLRRAEMYNWVERTLVRHEYARLGGVGKGLVRRYVARMTGLSRAQVTRLIAGHRQTGRVTAVQYQRTKFATRFLHETKLVIWIRRKHVDRDDRLQPKRAHVRHVLAKMRKTTPEARWIRRRGLFYRSPAVHLERAHGGHQHGDTRPNAELTAFDVEELLSAKV